MLFKVWIYFWQRLVILKWPWAVDRMLIDVPPKISYEEHISHQPLCTDCRSITKNTFNRLFYTKAGARHMRSSFQRHGTRSHHTSCHHRLWLLSRNNLQPTSSSSSLNVCRSSWRVWVLYDSSAKKPRSKFGRFCPEKTEIWRRLNSKSAVSY